MSNKVWHTVWAILYDSDFIKALFRLYNTAVWIKITCQIRQHIKYLNISMCCSCHKNRFFIFINNSKKLFIYFAINIRMIVYWELSTMMGIKYRGNFSHSLEFYFTAQYNLLISTNLNKRGILPDAYDRFYHKNIHQLVIVFILFRDSKIRACFSEILENFYIVFFKISGLIALNKVLTYSSISSLVNITSGWSFRTSIATGSICRKF